MGGFLCVVHILHADLTPAEASKNADEIVIRSPAGYEQRQDFCTLSLGMAAPLTRAMRIWVGLELAVGAETYDFIRPVGLETPPSAPSPDSSVLVCGDRQWLQEQQF